MGAKRKAIVNRPIAKLPQATISEVNDIEAEVFNFPSESDKKAGSSVSQFDLGDEIIICEENKINGQRFEDGVWSVRSIENDIMLQILYGCSETVKDDIDYSKIFAPKGVSLEDLTNLIKTGRAQHIKIIEPKKEVNLEELCLRSLADQTISFRRLCTLPPNLLTGIRARAEEIAPIPIDYRIRRLADHCHNVLGDGPRMRQLTGAGASAWSRRAWRLTPASLSYPAIWRACARTLLPSRPAQIPPSTRLLLEAEPVQGAAAFHRDYAAACRRREPSFPLEFDHVWLIASSVISCGPAGRIRPGKGW